jgi:Na+-transporting NADH:ubiquinone oxidoreductase subunit A
MWAGDIERMEQLGVYEVVEEDFALCEVICTSKQPLQSLVREALDTVYAEMK